MTGTALERPVRVIRELSRPELFARWAQRSQDLLDGAIARAHADYAERMKEGYKKYLDDDQKPEAAPEEPNGTPAAPVE